MTVHFSPLCLSNCFQQRSPSIPKAASCTGIYLSKRKMQMQQSGVAQCWWQRSEWLVALTLAQPAGCNASSTTKKHQAWKCPEPGTEWSLQAGTSSAWSSEDCPCQLWPQAVPFTGLHSWLSVPGHSKGSALLSSSLSFAFPKSGLVTGVYQRVTAARKRAML